MNIGMKTAAANLNAFHLFAVLNKGDDNRIAQFGANRTIRVAAGDHIRTPFRDAIRAGLFAHWGRHGETNAQENDKIRAFFITNLLRTLGCDLEAYGIAYDARTDTYTGLNKDNLQAAARSVFNNDTDAIKVLKLGDYGCGRPLTVRRITAALSAAEGVLGARAELEDENGVNRQLRQGIHMGGFAEDVVSQNVQGAKVDGNVRIKNPQPAVGQKQAKVGPSTEADKRFISSPLLDENADIERDCNWADDVIKRFRDKLNDDDYDVLYDLQDVKSDGQDYNALMKLGESEEVKELLARNDRILRGMRAMIEKRLEEIQPSPKPPAGQAV